MTTMVSNITLKDRFVSEFETGFRTVFGSEGSAIGEKRKNAMEHFILQGIPTRKDEEYKYTNTAAFLKGDFSFSTSWTPKLTNLDITAFIPGLKDPFIVVLVNGKFSRELSVLKDLPDGLTISSLKEAYQTSRETVDSHYGSYADPSADSFTALNTALASDGYFIEVKKGTVVSRPVFVLNLVSSNTDLVVFPRNLVVLEENSRLRLVERFETIELSARAFTNSLTEVYVGAKASMDCCRIQNECENGLQVNTLQVFQASESKYAVSTFSLNGLLVRNNLNIVLEGEHIESNLYGLYLLDGEQHVDNHTLVDHRKPHCNSNELYKGIMSGSSTGVFNGKIFVRQDAQKTNAFQSNKNLLMSDDASINTKPQLEIYADDVKCSHGTSTGKVDEEALFYLRSRGITEESAKKLLLKAFAEEVVEFVKPEGLKNYLDGLLSVKFS